MGTPNFYRKNAPHVFVLPGSEDCEDEIMANDAMEEFRQRLEAAFLEFEADYGAHPEDIRNFNAQYLGTIPVYYTAKENLTFSAQIGVLARAGYYTAANIDWFVRYDNYMGYETYGDEYLRRWITDTLDDDSDQDLTDEERDNLSAEIEQGFSEAVDTKIQELIEFLKGNTETYMSICVASNGEEFLQRIN